MIDDKLLLDLVNKSCDIFKEKFSVNNKGIVSGECIYNTIINLYYNTSLPVTDYTIFTKESYNGISAKSHCIKSNIFNYSDVFYDINNNKIIISKYFVKYLETKRVETIISRDVENYTSFPISIYHHKETLGSVISDRVLLYLYSGNYHINMMYYELISKYYRISKIVDNYFIINPHIILETKRYYLLKYDDFYDILNKYQFSSSVRIFNEIKDAYYYDDGVEVQLYSLYLKSLQ